LDRRTQYREVYLRSDHWKRVRREALERAGNKCQRCSASGPLDVHHRTYKRLGGELPSDLQVLCRTCHDAVHAFKAAKKAAAKRKRSNAEKDRAKRARRRARRRAARRQLREGGDV
jgi:5-methylcytosine-specific restriction endonuclease McrA